MALLFCKARASRIPLKSKVTSSSNCPQTGIWECDADTPGITEHRHFIVAGQPMPYRVVQRPAKGLGGFLGKAYDDTMEITWTLIAYEKDTSYLNRQKCCQSVCGASRLSCLGAGQ